LRNHDKERTPIVKVEKRYGLSRKEGASRLCTNKRIYIEGRGTALGKEGPPDYLRLLTEKRRALERNYGRL